MSSEIDSRMVVLTQDGTHQEVSAQLSATHLYQNLYVQTWPRVVVSAAYVLGGPGSPSG